MVLGLSSAVVLLYPPVWALGKQTREEPGVLSVNAKEDSVCFVIWVVVSASSLEPRELFSKGVHRHTWKPISSFFHERPLQKICFSSLNIYHVKLFGVGLMQLLHYFKV